MAAGLGHQLAIERTNSGFRPIAHISGAWKSRSMTIETKSSQQEDRRNWRLLWLGSIQAFADSETQLARWPVSSKRPSQFSFANCMSSYFDEANLREENAYQNRLATGQVTTAEIEATKAFHSLAETYESPRNDDGNSQAILRDPNWQAVVRAAQDAQQRLLGLLTDETEKEALTKPLYGRERVDSFQSSIGAIASSAPVPRPMTWSLRRGEFTLTKVISSRSASIPAEVRKQLVPLGFRASQSQRSVVYRRPFRLGRDNRLFAAFSEVGLGQKEGLWVLRLKYSNALWLVFAIFPLALVAIRPLRLIGLSDLVEAVALPTALVVASLLLIAFRLSRWWNRL